MAGGGKEAVVRGRTGQPGGSNTNNNNNNHSINNNSSGNISGCINNSTTDNVVKSSNSFVGVINSSSGKKVVTKEAKTGGQFCGSSKHVLNQQSSEAKSLLARSVLTRQHRQMSNILKASDNSIRFTYLTYLHQLSI